MSKVVQLGDVADIITGPFGSQLHESDYKMEGIPVIMPQDIKDGKLNFEDVARISENDFQRLIRYSVQNGDIIFPRRGDIEKHAYIDSDEDFLCGTGCFRVRVKTTEINSKYLSYYLDNVHVRKWITNHAVGSNMPNLNTGILSEIPVMIPTYSVQIKIARLLSVIEAKIQNNVKINDNLGKQIETLYSYWFNQFNFPNENGAPYSDSNGFTKWNSHIKRQIPKSWEVKNIRDITNLTWGQCPQGEHIFPNNMTADNLFDYCSGAGDMNGGLLVDCQGKTDDSKRFAYPNDILISIAGKIGNMCLVDHKISLGRAALAFTAKDQEIIPYIYMTLKSLNKKIVTVSTGSIQKVISDTNVDDFNFAYSEEIVKKFCLCANPLFHKIIKLEQEKKELIRLRNWLLPMLMNGQAIIED